MNIESLVGTVFSDALLTVAGVRFINGEIAIRIAIHPDGELGTRIVSSWQRIPRNAFADEESLSALIQYEKDEKNFTRDQNGKYLPRSQGGNSYTLQIIGAVRFKATEKRVNPTTGQEVTGLGGFTHGVFRVQNLTMYIQSADFDPSLGVETSKSKARR